MSNFLRKLKRQNIDLQKNKCCGKKMQYKESHNIYICMNCGKQKRGD